MRIGRGHRCALVLGAVLAALTLTSCKYEVTFAVTTTADGGDSDPGDGVCEMASQPGECSLRAAIDEANALLETTAFIELAPGVYPLSSSGADDDGNATGDLDLAPGRFAVLDGMGPGVVIDGGGTNRVIDNAGVLGLRNVTVTGGSVDGDGGGVRVTGGLLMTVDATITGNEASGSGGGVAVLGDNALMTTSTISGNVAADGGGGVYVTAGANANISNSTVTGNVVDPTVGGAGLASASVISGADVATTSPSPTGGDAPAARGDGTAAAGNGRQPVIIELAVDVAPELQLAPQQRHDQRQRIATASQSVADDLAADGQVVRRTYTSLPMVAATVDGATLARLGARPDVKAVHPDRLDAPVLTESISWINADDAQAAGHRGDGVTVAVVDSGVDTSHLMMSGKVVAEACFASGATTGDSGGDCPNGTPTQVGAGAGVNCPWLSLACWHGTHVASTAIGSEVFAGSDAFVGVAPGADLVAVNVFSRFTGSANCGPGVSQCILSWTSDQLAALDHISTSLVPAHDLAAINMSIGGGQFTSACDADVRAGVIEDLREAGVATVISSGNSSYKSAVGAPGCISAAITVGASGDTSDDVASFSNSSASLDLLAPGVDITAAYPGNKLATASGTSMAAPHVSGAVAVLRALDPAASVDGLEAALEEGGVPVTDAANGRETPRLDLAASVGALGGPGRGGGIDNEGTLTLTFTTVTANEAAWGAGLAGSGTSIVAGSIIATQASGRDCGLSGAATIASGGSNLDSDETCELSAPTDQSGVDPVLGGLADNGGRTLTHLPAAGSPPIGSIPLATPGLCDGTHATDQRGAPRPSGPGCDIGAVEQ